ncbi:MAG: HIG1 domain-containing protein [Gammaproteobacteria bacterium]|nr:HIG1 domain-containing protein [Gammaproteobacteria bacterium]
MLLATILVSIGLFLTVLALGVGVWSMAHGGEFDDKHATELMFARVASQVITVVVLVVAVYLLGT